MKVQRKLNIELEVNTEILDGKKSLLSAFLKTAENTAIRRLTDNDSAEFDLVFLGDSYNVKCKKIEDHKIIVV